MTLLQRKLANLLHQMEQNTSFAQYRKRFLGYFHASATVFQLVRKLANISHVSGVVSNSQQNMSQESNCSTVGRRNPGGCRRKAGEED